MRDFMRFAVLSSAALLIGLPAQAASQGETRVKAAPNTSRTASQSPERRICRSEVETGSLARRSRRCFTQAEWDRIARAARDNTQYELDRNNNRPSGQ